MMVRYIHDTLPKEKKNRRYLKRSCFAHKNPLSLSLAAFPFSIYFLVNIVATAKEEISILAIL